MDIVVLHNPGDPISRKVLELLGDEGLEPVVVDYLRDRLGAEELRTIVKLLDLHPRAVMRTKEPIYRRLGLDDPALSPGQLIEAMAANPRLIDGPIVVTEDEAVIARPADRIYKII